jgi:U3 small nucleolar RNA-associated protein 13
VSFVGHGTEIVSTASDGIIKIWDIKSNECVNTIEGHTDKIWAMTLSKDESRLITAAADSEIHIWKDCTAEDVSQKRKEEQERILK